MKQNAIRVDINYISKKLELTYGLVDDTTAYLTTNQTVQRITTCGGSQVPGVLITCTLLTTSGGSSAYKSMSIDVSRLGFRTGETIDYVEIQFRDSGGGSKGAIVMRTGFPY
jgi:hypothetical protein